MKPKASDSVVREFLLATFRDTSALQQAGDPDPGYIFRGELHMAVYLFCEAMGLSGYAQPSEFQIGDTILYNGTYRLNTLLDTTFVTYHQLGVDSAPNRFCVRFNGAYQGSNAPLLDASFREFVTAYVLRRKLQALHANLTQSDEQGK